VSVIARAKRWYTDPAPPPPPFNVIDRAEDAAPDSLIGRAHEEILYRVRRSAEAGAPLDRPRARIDHFEALLLGADPYGDMADAATAMAGLHVCRRRLPDLERDVSMARDQFNAATRRAEELLAQYRDLRRWLVEGAPHGQPAESIIRELQELAGTPDDP